MRNKPNTCSRYLMLVEAIAFATLCVVASQHFGFVDGLKITAAYLVAYLVPRITLTRCRGTSTGALVALFVLAVILMSID